jgi:hypothetical protein
MSQTAAQQYAAQRADRIVPDMLTAIDAVKRNTQWIARAALAVSTPHQVLFIASLGHPTSTVDIVAAWVFALLIPAVTDLGMLTMLRITQTECMHQQAKRRALIVLLVLVAESATVNGLAPGLLVLRVLVGFTAVVLALVEWVHGSVRVDTDALAASESQAIEQAQPADVIDPTDEARRAARRERDRQRRADKRAAKLAAEAAAAQRKSDAAERARLRRQTRDMEHAFEMADAPVSGADTDWRTYS